MSGREGDLSAVDLPASLNRGCPACGRPGEGKGVAKNGEALLRCWTESCRVKTFRPC